MSFIARGAAEETYAYYSSIQMTNCTLGYPIVTGCHNTHRVTALRQVGGFAPHAANDFALPRLWVERSVSPEDSCQGVDAGRLAYAKWPIFLLALYNVLGCYRGPYTIARKAGTETTHSILLVPHILIISLVSTAWVSGMVFGRITNPLLHVSGAFIVLGSLSLMLTTRLGFPNPYEPSLRAKAMEGRLSQNRVLWMKD